MSDKLKNNDTAKTDNKNTRVELLREIAGIKEGPKEDGAVSDRLMWLQSQLMAMNEEFKVTDQHKAYEFYEPAAVVSFVNQSDEPVTLYIAPVGQVVEEDGGFFTFDRASSAIMGLELVRHFHEQIESGKTANAAIIFLDGQNSNLTAYQISTMINFGYFGMNVGSVVELGPYAGHDFRVMSRTEEVYGELQNAVADKGLKTQNHDWGSEITSVLEELGVPAVLVDSFRAKEPALQWTEWYSPEDQAEFAATSDFDQLCEVLSQQGLRKG